MIYSFIFLRVNTRGCVKSYIMPLVFLDTIVNFYPEMISARLVNVLIFCVLWPWGNLRNVGHRPLGIPKVGILCTGVIRTCSKKRENQENILKVDFTRRKKEMSTICYELGNYYLILTKYIWNVLE